MPWKIRSDQYPIRFGTCKIESKRDAQTPALSKCVVNHKDFTDRVTYHFSSLGKEGTDRGKVERPWARLAQLTFAYLFLNSSQACPANVAPFMLAFAGHLGARKALDKWHKALWALHSSSVCVTDTEYGMICRRPRSHFDPSHFIDSPLRTRFYPLLSYCFLRSPQPRDSVQVHLLCKRVTYSQWLPLDSGTPWVSHLPGGLWDGAATVFTSAQESLLCKGIKFSPWLPLEAYTP